MSTREVSSSMITDVNASTVTTDENISSLGKSQMVKAGDYIVIQRQDYFKLHKVSQNGTANLGKDVLDIGNVLGRPFWTTYRLEQKKGGKRNYQLKECSIQDLQSESLTLNKVNAIASGTDNRNILDDGSSQKLSMEEIVSLRNEGLSSKEIVGTLIENSKTFQNKTEYSQQKYLKKKEKKYFEYITVRKPTVRLIAEIMFRLDQGKILGLRMDTLSQVNTAVNLHSHGTYILFESGCQGLAAASMLNCLSGDGRLVQVHPGNYPQKHALLALNLTEEQENCLISVNIYNLLRKLKADRACGVDPIKMVQLVEETDVEKKIEPSLDHSGGGNSDTSQEDSSTDLGTVDLKHEFNASNSTSSNETDVMDCAVSKPDRDSSGSGKRKHTESGNDDESAKKKSRWEVEVDKATSVLSTKADGLVIVCREHPTSILNALLPLVAPSRNFVVYNQHREPLQELLVELGKRSDVINLRLTDTWLRYYQVESNRTHPLVNMTGSGGYLLSGVVVDSSD